jgi:hypothetical protein
MGQDLEKLLTEKLDLEVDKSVFIGKRRDYGF